jgi:hypothetical protein
VGWRALGANCQAVEVGYGCVAVVLAEARDELDVGGDAELGVDVVGVALSGQYELSD